MNQQQLYQILVVDDDRRLRSLLEKYLSDHGYLVTAVADAKSARQALDKEDINLIVLDSMMPEESGLVFIEKLRQDKSKNSSSVPVLMLSALSEPEQRIKGLEKGADDYLTKPFEPRELLLRIQKIISRFFHSPATDNSVIILGRFQFDLRRKTLQLEGQEVLLSSTENRLLEVLAHSPYQELSREQLAVRSGIHLSPRTIDVQVTRLRRKIEENPRYPRYLRTIRHKGYALYPSNEEIGDS